MRKSTRVLYVDDDEALVFLTQRVMTRMGYSVTGHTDPVAALAYFEGHPDEFDWVVIDLSMPKMSGFELARAMLAIRPDLPIVLTSGDVRSEDQETAAELGIRSLILKPNTVEELGQILAQLLNPA
jgi:CheY-like chemotaxis protein